MSTVKIIYEAGLVYNNVSLVYFVKFLLETPVLVKFLPASVSRKTCTKIGRPFIRCIEAQRRVTLSKEGI